MKYVSTDSCIVCSKSPTALHHVTSRKAGGSDNPDNLMPLCGPHHTEIHAIGIGKMVSRHISVLNWLIANDRQDALRKVWQ